MVKGVMGELISDDGYETFLTDATVVEPVAVITEIPDLASDLVFRRGRHQTDHSSEMASPKVPIL